jgi:hypothetical protein
MAKSFDVSGFILPSLSYHLQAHTVFTTNLIMSKELLDTIHKIEIHMDVF